MNLYSTNGRTRGGHVVINGMTVLSLSLSEGEGQAIQWTNGT
jgi:hypothetical protein